MRRIVSLSVSTLLLASCGRTDEVAGHRFNITREDGVEVAVTSGGPKYEGELFAYREELRLVADPEHPDSYLVNPDPPVMDAAGNYYVNDPASNQIVVYDAQGRFRHTIGREGQGPGDLDFPRNLRIVGDTLYVNSHFASWRLTRFTLDGRLVDLTVHRVATSMAMPTLYRAPSGRFLIRIDDLPMVGDDWFVESRMVVLSADEDTVAVIETPRVQFGRTVARDDQGTPYPPVLMEYMGYPSLGFRPEQGIFISTGMEPVLRFYDLTGAPTRVIRIEMAPEEITPEERDAFLDSLRSELVKARNQPAPHAYNIDRLEAEIADPPFPPHKAYWRGVDIDDAGWIWLTMAEPPQELQTGPQAPRCRVLSPEGEYLGDTVWPVLVAGHVQSGRLLGIKEDPETGEKIPVVYRLVVLKDGLPYP